MISSGFIDSYKEHNKDLCYQTFHGFTDEIKGKEGRIDFIFTSKHFKINRSGIDNKSVDEKYPSDHYLVYSELI